MAGGQSALDTRLSWLDKARCAPAAKHHTRSRATQSTMRDEVKVARIGAFCLFPRRRTELELVNRFYENENLADKQLLPLKFSRRPYRLPSVIIAYRLSVTPGAGVSRPTFFLTFSTNLRSSRKSVFPGAVRRPRRMYALLR